MLYLLVSIAHHKQLAKVDLELLRSVEAGIRATCARSGIPSVELRDGKALFALGPEGRVDPRRALELALPLAAVLSEKKEELYGYQLLLAALEEASGPAVVRQLASQLVGCEEDGELWIDAGAIQLFSGLVNTSRSGELWRVLDHVLPREAPVEARQTRWVQERLVFQGFQALEDQLKRRGKGLGLHLHGPVGQDRRGILDALQERLTGTAAVRRFPRMYALFERRSTLHPFLNSLDPAFLPHVGRYLDSHERPVWASLADLLWYLKPSAAPGPPQAASSRPQPFALRPDDPNARGPLSAWPAGSPESLALRSPPAGRSPPRQPEEAVELWPDHLAEDFLLAYQLYLGAYFRMLEENFLPAALICEDVDVYQPSTLRLLAIILKDFAHRPSFLPIFSSARKELPEALAALNPVGLAVRPLHPVEMARLAAEQYPGLRLPGKDWLRLRLAVRGKPVALQHCLLYLQRKGAIAEENGQFRWQPAEGWEASLPKRPLTFSWQAAANLGADRQRVLFVTYLAQGLLDLQGLLRFLDSLGVTDAQAALEELSGLGLVHVVQHPVPVFPAFRSRLRRRVLAAEPTLEEKLLKHLVELWRKGAYPHRVLLFFLLAKSKQTAIALEVLSALLKRKLDELDFAGVRLFLEPKNFRLAAALSAEEQKNLAMLLGGVRIRYNLLVGSRKEAEAAYLTAVDQGSDFQVSGLKGDLFLQIGRFLATRGETNIALQWVKKSLIQFQSSGSPEERDATVELGSVLLAESRISEALEYFNLAGQTAGQAPAPWQLRLLGLRAAALFVQGNLSRARTETQEGLALARLLKRREWELFFAFVSARLLFELGSYAEAVQGFQEALGLEALYASAAARSVTYAWLARSFAYSGSPELALRILGGLKENWETCLFRAEALFFGRELAKALESCGQALSLIASPESFPGERVSWADGFSDLEGRCLVLAKDGALGLRLVQSLQAYIWGLEGSVERAAEQLHAITRRGRIPEVDPYQSLYHYWYASILPDLRQDEMDDRLTVLNKALQLLQQRASRIEDSTLRWHYLNNNHWNAGLFAEARRRKLI
jgi:tetratricopeptide (TPR) repeat protein